MKKQMVETCEMCSREVQNPTTIKVEGALLRVCHDCTQYGNIVKPPTSSSTGQGKRKISTQSATKRQAIRSSQTRRTSKPRKSDTEEKLLIPDYGKEIRQARIAKKLSHEQLSSLTGVSVAFIKSIETQKMKPTDRVAVKLEQELGIELFESPDVELEFQQKSNKKGLTVGDIVSIKRFEYD